MAKETRLKTPKLHRRTASQGDQSHRGEQTPGLGVPKVLNGRPPPKVEPLPEDFDITHHVTVIERGQTSPLSVADFAERIAKLKTQIG